MRAKFMTCVAAVALVATGGVRTASATSCHHDTEADACKPLRNCAVAILKEAKTYVSSLQNSIITSVDKNLWGKNQAPDGGKTCAGGTSKATGKSLIGALCTGNNGACKDGARKDSSCSRDVDCPGACSDTGLACTANGDCAIKCTGIPLAGKCNRSKGCNQIDNGSLGFEDDNDVAKCEVSSSKGIAHDFSNAEKKLRDNIKKKCGDGLGTNPGTDMDLADLGLPTAQCKGICRNTSSPPGSFEECATTKDCGNCKLLSGAATGHHCVVVADCTAAGDPGGTTCDTTGGTCSTSSDEVADCITQGMGGDLKNAAAMDAVTRPVTRIAYITQPKGVETGSGTLPQLPRRRSLVALSNLIQLAVKSAGDGAGGAGGSTQANLARCQGAGAKNGTPCLEDTGCKSAVIKTVGDGGTAKCAPDCCLCDGSGTCDNTYQPALNIASSVRALCTAAGQVVCETRGNAFEPTNLLGGPTATVANGIRTCAVTHTTRITDLTLNALGFTDPNDRGHCVNTTTGAAGDVCDDSSTCGADVCVGGLYAFGGQNLNTGAFTNNSPIQTEVYLTTFTPSGKACPVCVSKACDSGLGTGSVTVPCAALDNEVDEACLPVNGIEGGEWGLLASIPNPYALTTAKSQMTAAGSAPSHAGWAAGGGFCGYCSGVGPRHSLGCRTDYGLPANDPCTLAGVGTCTLTDTFAGFRADPTYDDDPTTAGMNATALGIPDLYAATAGGVFCAGETGDGLVDPSFGLPGPVRILQAYLVNWTFSTKK